MREDSHRIPHGLATPDGRIGALRAGDAGLLGVDLATGAEVWRTPAYSRIVGSGPAGFLVSRQAEEDPGRFDLAWIDPKSGRVQGTALAPLRIPVPLDADPAVRLDASIHAGTLTCRWALDAAPSRGGPRRADDRDGSSARATAGSIARDLATGEETASEAHPAGTAPATPLDAAPYQRLGRWTPEPWEPIAGSGLRWLRAPTGNGGAALVRSAAGPASDAAPLVLRVFAAGARFEVSADGRTAFAGSAAAATSEETWDVVDAVGGEVLFRTPLPRGAVDLERAAPDRLLYLRTQDGVPRLECFDLDAKRLLWSRPLSEAPRRPPPRRP